MPDELGIFARALHYAVDWTGEGTPPQRLDELIEQGMKPEYLETYSPERGRRLPTVYSALWAIAEAYRQRTDALPDPKTLLRLFRDGSMGLLEEQLGLETEAVKALAQVAMKTALKEKGNGSDLSLLVHQLREHYESDELLGMLHQGARMHGQVKPQTLLSYFLDQAQQIQQHSCQQEFVHSTKRETGDRALRYQRIKENPEMALGIPTGFTEFDRRTGGIYPGEVMLVTGITKLGKSLLRERILANMWQAGHYVADILSEFYAETAKNRVECMELARRGASSVQNGRTLSQALKQGELIPEDESRYFEMLAEFSELPGDMQFIEPTAYQSLDDLENLIAQLKMRYGLAALGVDDLHNQELKTFRTDRSDLQQGEIMNWLKRMAVRYHIAVVAEVQEDKATAHKRFITWSESVKYSSKLTQKTDIGVRLFRTEQPIFPEFQVLAHRNENDTDFRFRITLDKDRLLVGDAPTFATVEFGGGLEEFFPEEPAAKEAAL